LRAATKREEAPSLGVGVLGYGPISYAHGVSIQSVEGLEFRAVVDLNPERRAQAERDFPTVCAYQNAQELIADASVDVVIVATPPNTHARLTMDLLQAGKHVICEKPLCFTWQEAEQMLQTAETHQRLLSCHQNRRWDVDYLAIQQAIREGLIGEPFYLELFVGHYGHPCDYWHSHEPISGGTLYDWGAHYLDWALNLFPGQTASVVGMEHKRVWHDITNADQARAQVRFADGREVEFTYSDIAAVRKPKWYLLGTEGAIVGHWNSILVHQPDPVVFVREEEIPVTEATPHLTLCRRHPSGSMIEQQLALPQPQRPAYHLNIANHLLTGEPLAVSAHSSARVVAVLEAAARSAKQGGTTEEVCV
ncbi:MAG: Gfo/Idh/MocA family oxidoreductase, partial [Chloroflexota bacterium]